MLKLKSPTWGRTDHFNTKKNSTVTYLQFQIQIGFCRKCFPFVFSTNDRELWPVTLNNELYLGSVKMNLQTKGKGHFVRLYRPDRFTQDQLHDLTTKVVEKLDNATEHWNRWC